MAITKTWNVKQIFSKALRFAAFPILAASAIVSAPAIALVWDLNPPRDNVQAYVVYEVFDMTNRVKIGVAPATTNRFQLTESPGFHTYTIAASNAWGVGPFSNTSGWQAPPGQVEGVQIER